MSDERTPYELEAVFASNDEGTIMFACSFLRDAGIAYVVDGRPTRDLNYIGYNPLVGNMKISVFLHNADAARNILHKLDKPETCDPNEEDILEECLPIPGMPRAVKRIIIVSIIVVGMLVAFGIRYYMDMY